MPIILLFRPYWDRLAEWFKRALVAGGMIDEADLELFTVVDSADEVLETIFPLLRNPRLRTLGRGARSTA